MLFYVEWSAGVQSKDNHTLLCDDISRSRGSWNCFVIWQSLAFMGWIIFYMLKMGSFLWLFSFFLSFFYGICKTSLSINLVITHHHNNLPIAQLWMVTLKKCFFIILKMHYIFKNWYIQKSNTLRALIAIQSSIEV